MLDILMEAAQAGSTQELIGRIFSLEMAALVLLTAVCLYAAGIVADFTLYMLHGTKVEKSLKALIRMALMCIVMCIAIVPFFAVELFHIVRKSFKRALKDAAFTASQRRCL